MKIALIFLVTFQLILRSVMANGQLANPDTTRRTQPDSAALVRSDSTRPLPPTLTITGDLTLTKGFYTLRNQDTTYVQHMPWYLSGTLILTTRTGWTIPLQAVWSTADNGYGQGYKAIGVSPRYKNWLTLHGGFRNVEFSPLTLAGYTVLGAGVELNPGLLRAGLIAGRFNQAVETSDTEPDRTAVFRRKGYCAKVGIGNDHNYLDVLLLHVADDATSIRTERAAGITPAENVVLGLSGRIRTSQKLLVELDAAASAYTDDTHAEPLPTISPASNRPHYLNGLGKLLVIRPTTSIRTALQSSLSYRTKWADLKLRYKRIEPDYQSMGAYYLQSDLESVTVAPSIKLFRKQVSIRTSIGWQHDNLMNQKRKRTDRLIGSVSASYVSPKDLTLDVTYSNFGVAQRAGYRPLSDTVRIAQNTHTLLGSVYKRWLGNTMTHALVSSATYQELEDLNPFTTNKNQTKNWHYSGSYAWQHQPTSIAVNVGYSYTRTEGLEMSSLYYGPTLELSKRLLNNKLSMRLNVSLLKSATVLTGISEQLSISSAGLVIDCQITSAHQLSVDWTIAQNRGNECMGQQQGSVQYTVSF